jgi:hypothetical protein
MAVAWLLAGLPLLLLHSFRPVPMLVIAVPLAALLIGVVLRHAPYQALGRPGRQPVGQGGRPGGARWFWSRSRWPSALTSSPTARSR